jgi:hypothetical protein
MDHANHAPDTSRYGGEQEIALPVPANFTYVRVKKSDNDSDSLNTTVPLDFAQGITAKLRAYRETADQTDPSIEYQIAPVNPPLVPPLVPDNSPSDDPLNLRYSYVGTITVNGPDGRKWVLQVSKSHTDNLKLDLTNGLDVTCWFNKSLEPAPIGPMLNIDIQPQP